MHFTVTVVSVIYDIINQQQFIIKRSEHHTGYWKNYPLSSKMPIEASHDFSISNLVCMQMALIA